MPKILILCYREFSLLLVVLDADKPKSMYAHVLCKRCEGGWISSMLSSILVYIYIALLALYRSNFHP